MNDLRKTKAQLAAELAQLRSRVAELETAETARQQVEAALRESEERYRAIFEHAPVGFFQSTPEGRYLNVNPAMTRIYGYASPAEMIESVTDIATQIHGDPIRRQEFMRLMADQGTVVEFINQNYRKDGNPIHVSTNARAVKNQAGTIQYYEGFSTDITERKEAEDALRDSEARYRLLVEGVPGIVYSFSNRRGGLFYSSHVETVLGYTPDELYAHPMLWHDSIHPDDLPLVDDSIRHIERGLVFQIEYRIRDAHGNWRWFEDRSFYNRRSDAEIIIDGLAVDITGRKRAEAALRESEERFRLAFHTSPDAITISRQADDAYVDINEGFTALTGFTRQDAIGQTPQAINLWYYPGDQHKLAHLLRTAGYCENLEAHFRCKGGDLAIALVSARVITLQGVPHVLLIARDISSRKRMERALHENLDYLQAVLDSANDAVFVDDADTGQIIDVNRRMCEMYGYTREQALHTPIGDLSQGEPPYSQAEALAWLAKAREIGPQTFEWQAKRKDGQLFWAEVSIRFAQFGSANRFVVSVRDITERKQAEAALRESQALYQSLVEVLPLSICRKDLAGRFVFANKRFLEELNMALDDLVGKTDYDIHPPELAEKYQRDDRAVIDSGQTREFVEERAIVGGEATIIHSYKTPIYDSAGHVTGVQISFWDITARRQAEEAVRESESRLRQIASSLREAIWLRDTRTLEVLYVNPAYEELWGRTCESLYQDPQSFLAAVHPADIDRVRQAIQQQYQGIFFNQEYRIIRPDGSQRWIWGRTFPIRDNAGQLVRVTAIAEDITERRQTAERVQRYEFIVNAATEFMTLIDQQHVLVAANDAYCRAQDRSRAEIIGHSLAEVWSDGRYREKILPYVEQCFAGQIVRYEDTFAFDSGEERYYQVGMYPYAPTPGGPVTYAAIVTVDVTKRVRAEAAQRDLNLQLNQRLTEQTALLNATAAISSSLEIDTILQQVAEHMGVALNVTSTFICAWDPATGRSTVLAEWWGPNATAAEQQGSVGESYDLVGDFGDDLDQWLFSDRPFVSQVDDPRLYEPARQHMLAYGGQTALTVPLTIKGRSVGYVDLWESRRKREFGLDEIALAQGIARQAAVAMDNARLYAELGRHAEELEERVRQRTRQLSEANAQLSELDRMKDDFISRISHELRTPLTSIKIYLELLEAGKPEKRAKYMQVLNEQTNRLQRLIESLLEVTQKITNAADLHVAPTDLNHLIATLAADATARGAERGQTIKCALTPELPFVSADSILLSQALSNLVTNALNYTPPGGTIEFSTAPMVDHDEHWITVSVHDTGPGITPDDLPHIFDRFYRGHAAADYKTPGAGVGLAVSRDILTALGGRLTVDSQLGAGATFTAWLKPA